ncbi:MAG: N-acetyl sugar amidotransferase [Caldilineaceae bacterium]
MQKDVISKYGLPTTVQYCKRCVISNQRPRITFDTEGVCSACRYAEFKREKISWESREQEFREMLDKHRSKDGAFDVIVPCSGGKDSAFVAHQLKYKYNMHPLTVTWAPHIYTDIGWSNLQRFIASGFDNILGTPNTIIHRKLTKLAFEHLGDPFQPFIYGQKAFPMQIATKFKIPLIMYGENGEVEYGGDMKNANSPTHDLYTDLIKHYFSGMGPMHWTEYGIPEEELRRYLPPDVEEMKDVGVECHFFGYYKMWIPQENYYYAVEHTGLQANPDGRSEGTYSKYASLDDKIDGFHYYMAFIKFGIGRTTSDAAHEIRDGHITREEGVALVHKFDGEFPKKHFRDFLDYTELSEEEFWRIVDSFRSPHLWEKVNDQWRLKYQVS